MVHSSNSYEGLALVQGCYSHNVSTAPSTSKLCYLTCVTMHVKRSMGHKRQLLQIQLACSASSEKTANMSGERERERERKRKRERKRRERKREIKRSRVGIGRLVHRGRERRASSSRTVHRRGLLFLPSTGERAVVFVVVLLVPVLRAYVAQ